jgi:hypothetical protein
MKLIYGSLVFIVALLINPGCKGKTGSEGGNDAAAVADTGFTGIMKSMSGGHVAMETTFKNGVKEGLTKTFYPSGKVRGTLWYENGLREDSAKWYFEDGPLFRTTPYKRDTIDGVQMQYFRTGKLKARIGYRKGFRTFEFEEYDMKGRKVPAYPEMVISTKDDYNSNGTYTISVTLSDKSKKVKYFTGDFETGVIDTTRCVKINTTDGKGILVLKKSSAPQTGSVDILAAIMTFYGNNYLVHKKIELPYKDLN